MEFVIDFGFYFKSFKVGEWYDVIYLYDYFFGFCVKRVFEKGIRRGREIK